MRLWALSVSCPPPSFLSLEATGCFGKAANRRGEGTHQVQDWVEFVQVTMWSSEQSLLLSGNGFPICEIGTEVTENGPQ